MPGLRPSYVLIVCCSLLVSGCALTDDRAPDSAETEPVDSDIQVSARVLEPEEPSGPTGQANAAQRLEDPEVRLLMRSLERTGRHSPQELEALEQTLLEAPPENRRLLVSMLEQPPSPQAAPRSPIWDRLRNSLGSDHPQDNASATNTARRLSEPPRDKFSKIDELRDDYPTTSSRETDSDRGEREGPGKELMPPLEEVAGKLSGRQISSRGDEAGSEDAELHPASLVRDASSDSMARWFIALVGEFDDRNVKLVVSAEALPDGLYRGERLRFEFDRTVSRLNEMQSAEYLALPHLA